MLGLAMADQGCLLGFCLSQCCVDLNTTALERLFGGARGSLASRYATFVAARGSNCFQTNVVGEDYIEGAAVDRHGSRPPL